ncbi:LOW QUALITY PROTEIN: hypothetical protein HID58_065104, partial [Brassica napus]
VGVCRYGGMQVWLGLRGPWSIKSHRRRLQDYHSCLIALLMAEALTVRETLLDAKNSSIWIHSDVQKLIRAINTKTYPLKLFRVLMTRESLSSSFTFIFFSFITESLD